MLIEKDETMTTLFEALAAEREKKRQEATRRQVGRVVLQALDQRLEAEPLRPWLFAFTGDEILIARTSNGTRRQLGSWTVDEEMRLVLGQEKTEWITAESCARVIDEAVHITATFIVDTDAREIGSSQLMLQAPLTSVGSGAVKERPRLG
jgi:hypothetical protein